jgi:hypothetical protein
VLRSGDPLLVGHDKDGDAEELCGGRVWIMCGIHQLAYDGRGEHERQKAVVKLVYR